MSIFKAESLQIFKIKEFRLFILVRFFLTLAIQMQFSTIYLQVYYEYSKEELYLGLIGLTEAIPFIITSFFSGHIADKVHKKQILSIGILLLLFGAIFLFFNFKADRDVNIEAGRNVNIKSALNTNIESAELSLKANSNGYITVGSQLHENIGTDYFFTLGGDSHTVKADGKTDHATPSSRSGSTSATSAISVSNLTTFVLPETESIMKRVPQHEPWTQHVPTFSKASKF